MQSKPSTDEKILCLTWFIALFFIVLQIVNMTHQDNQYRRNRRSRRCREEDNEWILMDHEEDDKMVTIKPAA